MNINTLKEYLSIRIGSEHGFIQTDKKFNIHES